eukprot:Opistho-2@93958
MVDKHTLKLSSLESSGCSGAGCTSVGKPCRLFARATFSRLFLALSILLVLVLVMVIIIPHSTPTPVDPLVTVSPATDLDPINCHFVIGEFYARHESLSRVELEDLLAVACANQPQPVVYAQTPTEENAADAAWVSPLEASDASYVRSLAAHPERVLVLVIHFNRPELFPLQMCALREYFADDFDYVAINDAIDTKSHLLINAQCSRIGVRCISTPSMRKPRNKPSIEVGLTLDWALRNVGHPSRRLVFCFHADLMLVKPFSLRAAMGDRLFAGLPYSVRAGDTVVEYPIDAMFAYDGTRLPEVETLSMGCCEHRGVEGDTGILSAAYFDRHPQVKMQHFSYAVPTRDILKSETSAALKELLSLELDVFEAVGSPPYLVLFGNALVGGGREFVHIRSASGWNKDSTTAFEFRLAAMHGILRRYLPNCSIPSVRATP